MTWRRMGGLVGVFDGGIREGFKLNGRGIKVRKKTIRPLKLPHRLRRGGVLCITMRRTTGNERQQCNRNEPSEHRVASLPPPPVLHHQATILDKVDACDLRQTAGLL